MATLRVTSTTALMLVRTLSSDLRRFVTDAGALSAAPQLPRHLEDLASGCAPTSPLAIEVWIDEGGNVDEAVSWLLGAAPERWSTTARGRRVAEATLVTTPVRLVIGTAAEPEFWPSSAPGAAMIVWFHGDASAGEPGPDDDRVVLHISNADRIPAGSQRDQLWLRREAPAGPLPRMLASAKEPLIDVLHADAVAKALESLAAIAGLAFAQEARDIRAKRTLAQQRSPATSARAPAAQSDLMGGVRTRLHRVFTDFARGLDDRFVTAITAPSAGFWQDLEKTLESIDRIEQEVRVKTVATRLPAESEAVWLEMVRSALRRHGVADLSAMRDMLRVEGQEVEKAVAQAGGPPVVVQFQALTDERLDRVLNQYVASQRTYHGELPKPGFFEYLTIARRYQMVVFMFLSAFGLSFLRTYREFMIPAAILLLSLGGLQVAQSVRRERVESIEKELEKIKELLRNESKRIVGDVNRAWTGALSQHLADQLPVVLGGIEATVRDYFARQANESAEERQRLQRQLQAFETAERRLMAPEKSREAVANGVAKVRTELRQLLVSGLRTTLAQ